MELPTWKGAYCPCHVNPLSVRLFNHARGGLQIWTLPNASVGASNRQSCHVWHWCDIFAKVGPKSLASYSNSWWTEKLEIKIWEPCKGRCKMISENFRTKSAKMRPAKIKQMADLQKWFNDSIIAMSHQLLLSSCQTLKHHISWSMYTSHLFTKHAKMAVVVQ